MHTQTEITLRQAVSQRIKPILFINKMDLVLRQHERNTEEMYKNFESIISKVNNATSSDQMDELRVDPSNGSVCFGSGLQGWAFTLNQFSEIYAKNKFNMPVNSMMKHLWYDFYNRETKKFSTTKEAGSERAFCHLILNPICKVFDAVTEGNEEEIGSFLKNYSIKLKEEDEEKKGNALFKAIMEAWLPAEKSILQMIAIHLPSPVVGQKNRMKMLYKGPQTDPAAIAISNCDADAELMMQVRQINLIFFLIISFPFYILESNSV